MITWIQNTTDEDALRGVLERRRWPTTGGLEALRKRALGSAEAPGVEPWGEVHEHPIILICKKTPTNMELEDILVCGTCRDRAHAECFGGRQSTHHSTHELETIAYTCLSCAKHAREARQ
jgi:hypothetical protein